jgi:hypothetical protein
MKSRLPIDWVASWAGFRCGWAFIVPNPNKVVGWAVIDTYYNSKGWATTEELFSRVMFRRINASGAPIGIADLMGKQPPNAEN